MLDPEHESLVLFPLEKGCVRVQSAEEGSSDTSFMSVEVWDWELYTIKGKRKKVDKTNHALRKREQAQADVENIEDKSKCVFLRGSVKSKTGVVVVRSAPLQHWSIQRVNSEYRVWVQGATRNDLDLWYLLGAKCAKDYEKCWEPWRKILQSFKPLLDAIGRGPPPVKEVDWLWPKTMKWNDVDAAVIMDHVESLQPSARRVLEDHPEFVLLNFFDTLPEYNYAGVCREECQPKWLTLKEYFEAGKKSGGWKYPQKTKRDVVAQNRQYSLAGEEEEDVDFDDSSKATLQPAIKCRICGGFTRSYERGDNNGIQHFALVEGERVLLDNAPMCDSGPSKKPKLKPSRKRSKKEEMSPSLERGGAAQDKPLPQFGFKKKKVALAHSFGAVPCPLCPKRLFNLPDQAAAMEKHVRMHLEGLMPSEATSFSNALRVRVAVEGIFPSEMI